MYFVFAYIFFAYTFSFMYQYIKNVQVQGPYLQSIYTRYKYKIRCKLNNKILLFVILDT